MAVMFASAIAVFDVVERTVRLPPAGTSPSSRARVAASTVASGNMSETARPIEPVLPCATAVASLFEAARICSVAPGAVIEEAAVTSACVDALEVTSAIACAPAIAPRRPI